MKTKQSISPIHAVGGVTLGSVGVIALCFGTAVMGIFSVVCLFLSSLLLKGGR